MDRARRDDVRRVEQFRRSEELARVDETLPRLPHVARLAGALAPTHRRRPSNDAASPARANVALGDRLFPGRHERATFTSAESADAIAVAFTARESPYFVDAAVGMRDELADSELFASTTEASNFFRAGAAGFSPTGRSDRLDGLELRTTTWRIEPAEIHHVRSSFFDDRAAFPAGSIHLDSALVMRDVAVEWHSLGSLSPGHGHPLLTSA